MFPAEDENDLIGCIAELLGEPSFEFMKVGTRASLYFNSDGSYRIHRNSRGILRKPKTRSLTAVLKGADEGFLLLIENCLK